MGPVSVTVPRLAMVSRRRQCSGEGQGGAADDDDNISGSIGLTVGGVYCGPSVECSRRL